MTTSPVSIFLSYRRSDSPDIAGRIFDRLRGTFGPERVLKDVDSIPLACDFRDFIVGKVAQSAMLVLIGPTWATCTKDGLRRLDHPEDIVRQEIETAFEVRAPVVPVLVTNADMPSAGELPQSLRRLTELNGIRVRPDPDFHNDMRRLETRLAALVADLPRPTLPRPEMIQNLLKDCQDWYNEIVHVIARMVQIARDATRDHAERQREIELIDFVYQNTRTYLPKVMAARHTLSHCSGTDGLLRALDNFLACIAQGQNDGPQFTGCHQPAHWIQRADGLNFAAGAGVEMQFADYALSMPLIRAQTALGYLANEVAAFDATRRQ